MRSTITITTLAALALLAGIAPAMATASTADTGTDVTFRAAPAGFVVPSLFIVDNEAQWVVDPANDDTFNGQDGVAGCQLAVTDSNDNGVVDGVDALDRALETGCIDSWSARGEEDCSVNDVFVSEVDGLAEVFPATFWIVHHNAHLSSVGVCDMDLADGDSIGFVYE